MISSNNNLLPFLKSRIAEMSVTAQSEGFLASPLFHMVLRGEAKLPLDRVEEVARILGVDVQQLFRLAARQFYDEKALYLLERMLGTPMTNEEQKWLHEIRSATDGPVAAPGEMAKRLVRALVRPRIST